MKDKETILIDGENFRHQLSHILHENSKIKDKSEYFKFDLRSFLEEVLNRSNLDIIYYTTRIKQPRQRIPVKLKKRIDAISEFNRRWSASLSNQKIKVVKAGYLRVRDSNPWVHCGKRTLVLQEKGVDVRVATDLVAAGYDDNKKSVILGSSDSDLVPAVKAAKHSGLKVTYLCYAGWLNRSVASQTHKTITFDDTSVLKYFKELDQ